MHHDAVESRVILLQIITFYIHIIYIKHVQNKAQNVQHFYVDRAVLSILLTLNNTVNSHKILPVEIHRHIHA